MTRNGKFSKGFDSFGTRVLFTSNDAGLLAEVIDVARNGLLGNLEPVATGPFPLVMNITQSRKGLRLERNGAYITSGRATKSFFKHLDGIIRISVGEYAPDLVFLHAGAVAWRGKGIVMPADSFTGKSSLVTELVKAGAEYYSDDFAIIDRGGSLHPFARPISMRTREETYSTYELSPVALGAKVGVAAIPIGMVLITRYRNRARWSPRKLSSGDGVLGTIPFTLALRRQPGMCLEVLNSVADSATIVKTERGDARATARRVLEFVDCTIF